MKNLNELARQVYVTAQSKGWYETIDRLVVDNGALSPTEAAIKGWFQGTSIALMQSELSEALEAIRKNRWANLHLMQIVDREEAEANFERRIKDTVEDELADTIIRILDFSARYDIDIQRHVELKMQYNESRPIKHGGKSF